MTENTKQCSPSCCGNRPGPTRELPEEQSVDSVQGPVPVVETRLTWSDRFGGWRARWGWGRSRYRIPPGLYAIGTPDAGSVVLVTANYKLTFDMLRKELGNLDAWILVLDTQGINVWCAAGKGTFGTGELIRQIRRTGLFQRVSHRTLILPQLGAPGVAAHEIKQETGFRVVYGPVRARDIHRFLGSRMVASEEMRAVTFGLRERLAVIPVELVTGGKYLILLMAAVALFQLMTGNLSGALWLSSVLPVTGAFLAGTLVTPVLLPWLPFHSFALKGWLVGCLWGLGVGWFQGPGWASVVGNLLLLPAISAFLALNFTGSTTFTSQTGVNKEVRLFARPMAVSGILGLLFLIGAAFR